MSLLDLIPHQEAIAAHRPWPRVLVGEQGWLKAIDLLAAGDVTLLGFWGEVSAVHLVLLGGADEIAIVSLECESRKFPSVAARRAPAGLTNACRATAKDCTRSRSVRCTRGSSSPVIFDSPPTVSTRSGSKS